MLLPPVGSIPEEPGRLCGNLPLRPVGSRCRIPVLRGEAEESVCRAEGAATATPAATWIVEAEDEEDAADRFAGGGVLPW